VGLTATVYRTTKAWPREERYGLTSQACPAATSIASNIAEGYGRENPRSYVQFLLHKELKKLETHLR
jgi:four helix bundle protein